MFTDSHDRETYLNTCLKPLFFESPSVTEHWGNFHNIYSPYWERDFINLYSLTSFQHIFMQYDVNIFFLWKRWGYFFVTVSGMNIV